MRPFKAALVGVQGEVVPEWVRRAFRDEGVDFLQQECTSREDLERHAAVPRQRLPQRHLVLNRMRGDDAQHASINSYSSPVRGLQEIVCRPSTVRNMRRFLALSTSPFRHLFQRLTEMPI